MSRSRQIGPMKESILNEYSLMFVRIHKPETAACSVHGILGLSGYDGPPKCSLGGVKPFLY